MNHKYNGAIALPMVILLSSLLLISGLTIIMTSIDVRMATKGFNQSINASMQSDACLEESVEVLKFDGTYTGSFNITFPSGSCDAVVSNIGGDPTQKEVVVSSTYEDVDFEETYHVDVTDYPLVVTLM